MGTIVLDPGVALNLALLECAEELARDCQMKLVTAAEPLDETSDATQIGHFLDYSLGAAEDEARAAALAHCLAMPLATDSPKLRQLVLGRGGQTSSTLALLVRWTAVIRMPIARQIKLVGHLAQKALFSPPRCDPHFEWWVKQLRGC